MDVTLVQLSAVSVALIPVVLGLTQIVKAWVLDARWAPLVSLGLGISTAFLVPSTSIQMTVLQGILVGLAASGIFSGIKTTSGN